MRMKIIGGPRDGEYWEVDKFADAVRIPDPPKCVVTDVVSQSSIEYDVPYYRVHHLHHRNPNWDIWFVAPHDWSLERAVQHQFARGPARVTETQIAEGAELLSVWTGSDRATHEDYVTVIREMLRVMGVQV